MKERTAKKLLQMTHATTTCATCDPGLVLGPEISFALKVIGTGASLMVQWLRIRLLGFPGGAVVKNLPANAGDMGSSPGSGRSHMPRSN